MTTEQNTNPVPHITVGSYIVDVESALHAGYTIYVEENTEWVSKQLFVSDDGSYTVQYDYEHDPYQMYTRYITTAWDDFCLCVDNRVIKVRLA